MHAAYHALQRTAAGCRGCNRENRTTFIYDQPVRAQRLVAAVAEFGLLGDPCLINDYDKRKHAVFKMQR